MYLELVSFDQLTDVKAVKKLFSLSDVPFCESAHLSELLNSFNNDTSDLTFEKKCLTTHNYTINHFSGISNGPRFNNDLAENGLLKLPPGGDVRPVTK